MSEEKDVVYQKFLAFLEKAKAEGGADKAVKENAPVPEVDNRILMAGMDQSKYSIGSRPTFNFSEVSARIRERNLELATKGGETEE